MNRKKLDKLASLYVVVAVFVAIVSVFSFTFAWYVKTSTQYLNITFAPPIVIDLDNNVQMITPIEGNTNALLPGSKVSINLGFKMNSQSSVAYVRAKMAIVFEDVFEADGTPVLWDNFVNVENSVVDANWVRVDFSKDPTREDWWYVCKTGSAGNMISREVSPGDEITFANGTIDLLLNLDNRFAEKKIEIMFVVESIQTVGVEDPLANGIGNAKYHEVWGS